MKITITLEDALAEDGGEAVRVECKFDPKPTKETAETRASALADKIWKTISEEQNRLPKRPAPSKILNRLGEPIPASQAICQYCGKRFPSMFSSKEKCDRCEAEDISKSVFLRREQANAK